MDLFRFALSPEYGSTGPRPSVKFFFRLLGGGHKIDLVSLSEGSRSPRAKATVTTSEGLRCPRARVAVSGLHERTVTVSTGQGSGVCKRGSKASRCPPRGPSCLRAKSRGLYERRPLSASEGRGVCESRCPQRSRTSRAKGRGLHELGVARGSTLVERGSFDGLVRLVHVPKVEETRTILDFLWYGRVTDQRRVESTFDVRRSTFDRSKASIRIACSMCLVPVCHHQAQALCIPQQPSSIVDGRVTRPTSSRVR